MITYKVILLNNPVALREQRSEKAAKREKLLKCVKSSLNELVANCLFDWGYARIVLLLETSKQSAYSRNVNMAPELLVLA